MEKQPFRSLPQVMRALRISALLAVMHTFAPGIGQAQVSTSYSFTSHMGTYAPISGGTVLWSGSFDNSVSPAQAIPAFNFNGAVHNSMYVSTNGFITFGAAPTGTNFSPVSGNEPYAGAISAFGTDIEDRSVGTCEVRWQQIGNEVVIQWTSVRRQNQPEYFNFQIRLNTVNGKIAMVYGTRSAPGSSTTLQPEVGLRGANNLLLSNLNGRRVGTGAETWAASLASTSFSHNMRFTNTSPAKFWTSGQTFLWTPCPTPAVGVSPGAVSYCPGGNVTLTASGATNYAWSPAIGLSANTGSSVIADPSSSTTYTVVGANAGCAFTDSATVDLTVLPAPTVPIITPSSASICEGSSQALDVSATSVGTVTRTFMSDPGPAVFTVLNAHDASIYPWNLSVSGLPVSGVTIESVTLNGVTHTDSDDLDIVLQAPSPGDTNVILMSDVGGDGHPLLGVTYTFANGAPAMSLVTANPTGTYSPTNQGASDRFPTSPGPGNSFTQASPSLTMFTGDPNGTWKLLMRDDAKYDGGNISSWSITFSFVSTVSYTWSPATGLSSTTDPSVSATPLSTQTYTVTASHTANTCTEEANVTVTVNGPQTPTVGIVAAPMGPICNGTSVTFTANTAGTGGGTIIYDFKVDGISAQSGPASTYTTTSLTNGQVVTCDIAVANGACLTDSTASASGITMVVNAAPVVSATATDESCGGNADGTATALASGGTPGYDYQWDNGGTTATITGLSAGMYTVMVSDAAGCKGIASASVNSGTLDTDGDGVLDCDDGCPNDPNKIWEGICGCGNPDVDGDGDSVMDCLDGCPTDPNKITPGACGCGTPETDTDGDASADCIDLCPLDPNKTAPGSCGCGNAEPGTSCDDGDPNTGNDVVNANCQCEGSALDCTGVPGGPAQPGTGCDDGDPSTTNDVYDANCACAGTPGGGTVGLTLNTDANGDQTSWEIIPIGGGAALCSGSNYTSNSSIPLSCPLPDGCFVLRVLDSFGDGMTTGGYTLRDEQNQRIIDNDGDGDFTFTSQLANGQGFCLPLGNDRIRPSRCDLENLLPTDWVAAEENPAVSAQFGVGNQADDGYQFWFFNPDGGYSRRVLLTHATNNYLFPWGAGRCSYVRLSDIMTQPLPHNTLLNVRVRCMINGIYNEFGPACRLKIDLVDQCPTTQLVDDPNSPSHSCGITNVMLDGSQYLYAAYVANVVNYQFEFDDVNSGYLRTISIPGSVLHLTQWATMPLEYGTTYSVRIRVTYDNGATYCPWGNACTITTAPVPPGQSQQRAMEVAVAEASKAFQLWPNPNRGDVLNLIADGLSEEADHADVVITDLRGTQMHAVRVPVSSGAIRKIIPLDGRLSAGVYLVFLTGDNVQRVQRLVIE